MRKLLDEIIHADRGENWWKPELFKLKVKPLLPQELIIVSEPPDRSENFNCFAYAFGLQNYSEFLGGNNPIQQEFVKWLMLNNTLIPSATRKTGELVFYESNQYGVTHGGIMQNIDTVISKWMYGPIIVHKLFSVPASFGDKISFFKSPGPEKIKKQYVAYRDTGVEIRPIG